MNTKTIKLTLGLFISTFFISGTINAIWQPSLDKQLVNAVDQSDYSAFEKVFSQKFDYNIETKKFNNTPQDQNALKEEMTIFLNRADGVFSKRKGECQTTQSSIKKTKIAEGLIKSFMGFSAGVAGLELLLKFLSYNSSTIARALTHIKGDAYSYDNLPDSPILAPGLTLAEITDDIIIESISSFNYREYYKILNSLISIAAALFLYGGYKGIKSGINAFQKGFRYKKFVTEKYATATKIKAVIKSAQSALS